MSRSRKKTDQFEKSSIDLNRNFLRWAGSKRKLLPIMMKHWSNQFERYVEPFAGSACFFFRLRPTKALLGDINYELIETYIEVKYRVSDVISAIESLEINKETYLNLREMDTSSLIGSERAARFIYLNRFCFNGLYRTNLQGKFNVPYGGDKSGSLPTQEFLKNCSKALKTARLIPGDFEKVLKEVKTGDFVYMDPPFRVKARRVFNEYSKHSFSDGDLERLRKWMLFFAESNIKFLVSYAESDEAEFLKKDFYSEVVSVQRNIAGFTGSRIKAREVLISPERLTTGD